MSVKKKKLEQNKIAEACQGNNQSYISEIGSYEPDGFWKMAFYCMLGNI